MKKFRIYYIRQPQAFSVGSRLRDELVEGRDPDDALHRLWKSTFNVGHVLDIVAEQER